MPDVSPRRPSNRPLLWPDAVLDLHDHFSGSDTPVYVVGGAVRDALLHHPIHDIDLTTPGDAIRIARRIANTHNGDFYVLDAERQVARALLHRPDGRFIIDVARFRGDSLFGDLTDRDFTFNAMAVDLTDDIALLIDPLSGEADLHQRILRRCAPNAIADDPLRALRAIRQSVALNTRIEPETLKDIKSNVERLAEPSGERVRDEFFKLLSVKKPASALRIAGGLGLLRPFLPQVDSLRDQMHGDVNAWDHTLLVVEKLSGILTTISPRRTDLTAAVFDLGMIVAAMDAFRAQLQEHIAQTWPDERSHESLLMLAALLHDVEVEPGELAATIAEDLRLSSDERKRLRAILSSYSAVYDLNTDDLSLHRFWRAHRVAGIDLCLVALAVYLAEEDKNLKQDAWIALVQHVQQILSAYFLNYDRIVAPEPLLSGDDLMAALNLKPGKHIGNLLKQIREAQVTGDVATVEDALELARLTIARLN